MNKTQNLSNVNRTIPAGDPGRFGLPGIFMLLGLLFASVQTFAQQPSCNLSGRLKAVCTAAGGEKLTFTAEVANVTEQTKYSWEFVSNRSNAKIVPSKTGTSVQVLAGNRPGGFTLKVTVANPLPENAGWLTSTCSKSVSVIKE